jgi:hypothetical protein
MTFTVPIGREESQELEFKGSAALRHVASIAREVAAMLNAGRRGEVWIGITDRDEVAAGIEPIDDALRARRQVEDALTDRIEPPPGQAEASVHVVKTEVGDVLVVDVRADPERGPYAFTKGGGRDYLVRFGARLRPLTREELREAFQRERGKAGELDAALEGARARLGERRTVVSDCLLLQVAPAIDQELELNPEQREMLADPSRTGNRAHGWTYGSAYRRFGPGHRRWELVVDARRGALSTIIQADGSLEFRAPLARLEREHEREIHPYALLEYPTSVLRMYRELLSLIPAPRPCPCVVGLALIGVRKWKLRPHSPRSLEYQLEDPDHGPRVHLDADVLPVDLGAVPWDDFTAKDDRVALRLIRGVYRSFGFEDGAIPREFDAETQMLRMPR